ncbi:YkvA family protein [Alkalicoccus daliensis]|uniref:Uncharacterized membrane protein YkvA, DUF1232 family n=1 Tax=Alkalicoccus daliensis TaxID=745820 RepID=A0A1H0G9P6_9BACI|nr:YkvA family protein [Alkalicoccus daliensis]SDO03568.1 Uncharacterized membrane protein YkvA, DUF1232 family [Alkalicoccus daliensis]
MAKWFNKKDKSYQEKLKQMDPQKMIDKSADEFEENKFWEKLRSYSKKMGSKLVYFSLLLFYSMNDPGVPKQAKLTIAGALGYLILPVDLIPDMIPVIGFADDLAVIVYAVYQIGTHISEETKEKAHGKIIQWFGEAPGNVDDKFMPGAE